jgi:hypothetical protein
MLSRCCVAEMIFLDSHYVCDDCACPCEGILIRDDKDYVDAGICENAEG